MTRYTDDYTDFNNEMAEILEEQSPVENFVDEPLIVSYSEVFKWDTCQRQYWYRFGMGLKPLEESNAMQIGTKGHKLLQDFYNLIAEGKEKHEAHILTARSAAKILSKTDTPDFTLLKAWTMVDNYIRENEFTPNAILVENRFLFPASLLSDDPIFEGVQIGFTPDVVFQRPGNKLDVEDAKFVGRAWSKSKLNRFQQAKLYQIFLKVMGYNVTRSVVRFFNLATGKITVQNYGLLEAEEKIIIRDFLAGIKEVVTYRRLPLEVRQEARRTTNYTACQFCAFEFPCTLEAEGKDASKTFKYQYMKSDYDYSR